MQISIVMLLFSDQISGRGKSFQGGKLPQGRPPAPLWKKASNGTTSALDHSACNYKYYLRIPASQFVSDHTSSGRFTVDDRFKTPALR